MIEGIDYSSTAHTNSPGADVLNLLGKKFVGRYAVGDKSPLGRGIHAAEYQRMVAGNIDVFLYWQTTTNWTLGGWDAGVNGAKNAQFNINAAGMPAETPVYFAVDFDAAQYQMAAIDECLEGAASVLGAERVGVYGGWAVIDHCVKAGTAKWFCQTLAWMYGRGWHPAAHLHQYGFNAWIDGTNCDLVRATVENYGQAIPPAAPPKPKPKPYAPIWLPDGWQAWRDDPNATVMRVDGYRFRPVRMTFVVKTLTTQRSKPDATSRVSGPKLDIGHKLHSAAIVDKKERRNEFDYWVQDAETGFYVLGSKLSPRITIEPW